MSNRARDTVLRLVRAADTAVTAVDVAERLDVHVTTARYHLRNLEDAGLVATVSLKSDGAGRPRVGYLPVTTIEVDAVLGAILDQLGPDEAARERAGAAAGRAWAAGHDTVHPTDGLADPLHVVTSALHRLGFRVSDQMSAFGTHEIRLCSCPLRHIGEKHPEVARGVARGAIEHALADASPVLADQYAVDVTPAAHGDCEITLRLSPVRAPAAR